MVHSFSSSMYLPYTLLETVGRFNDLNAKDMQCGDMGEQELQSLGLKDVSAKVDPYRLVRYDFSTTSSLDSLSRPNLPGRKISHLNELKMKLYSSRLTKFNSIEDRVNGLGISVHDVSAQKINLLNLNKYALGWSATIHFQAQDHFGLDIKDINNKIYYQFRYLQDMVLFTAA